VISFEQIQKANAQIRTTNIKGKEYAEVNQRIKAFRMCYPEGFIRTQLLSVENGVCIMRAEVGIGETILGTGTAYENEKSSYINKTSYIENCETSAVGRALGMAGFGIDTSVASYEEVANAINQQERTKKTTIEAEPVDGCISAKQWKVLQGICKEKEKDPTEVLLRYGYSRPSEVPQEAYNDMVKALEEGTL
jgi:hypothetical protein